VQVVFPAGKSPHVIFNWRCSDSRRCKFSVNLFQPIEHSVAIRRLCDITALFSAAVMRCSCELVTLPDGNEDGARENHQR
jgi:hypothetical protein